MHSYKSFFAAATVLSFLSLGSLTAKDKLDGRALYREYCKHCHTEESDAGEYTPMTLIQMQWKRFFSERLIPSHTNVFDEVHGGNVLDVISPEQMEAIKKFAIDHAADSEQPMSCSDPAR